MRNIWYNVSRGLVPSSSVFLYIFIHVFVYNLHLYAEFRFWNDSCIMSSLSSNEFQILENTILSGTGSDYVVEHIMGQGVFSKVARCLKLDTKETVAVKIFKRIPNYKYLFKKEVEMLKNISVLDCDKWNLVKWHESFIHENYACLAFEMLDMDLKTFLRERGSLSIQEIRPIAEQVATALCALKSINLIHCDLKPDNVMLVNHHKIPLKVKLIDFGLAHIHNVRRGTLLQARAYRAPEVTLGLPIAEAIDVWSLGCTMVALFQGSYPYWGNDEYELFQFLVKTQGQPKQSLLNDGSFTGKFFTKDWGSNRWRLKTPVEYYKKPSLLSFRYLPSLKYMLKRCQNTTDNVKQDTLDFLNLLQSIFVLDSSERITPTEVLRHQYITRGCNCADNTTTDNTGNTRFTNYTEPSVSTISTTRTGQSTMSYESQIFRERLSPAKIIYGLSKSDMNRLSLVAV